MTRRQQEGALRQEVSFTDLGISVLILPVTRHALALLGQLHQRATFRRGHGVLARDTAVLSLLRHLL